MPRPPIALALPYPLPPLPNLPHPKPTPLQNAISHTLTSTDYETVVVPLTNEEWQARWERLCLRPMEDEELDDHGNPVELSPDVIAAKEAEARRVDREADVWRRDGGLKRDWLELDSPDEGIRFDSELVSGCRQLLDITRCTMALGFGID
jgi:protein arginine N-methyltransferase 5